MDRKNTDVTAKPESDLENKESHTTANCSTGYRCLRQFRSTFRRYRPVFIATPFVITILIVFILFGVVPALIREAIASSRLSFQEVSLLSFNESKSTVSCRVFSTLSNDVTLSAWVESGKFGLWEIVKGNHIQKLGRIHTKRLYVKGSQVLIQDIEFQGGDPTFLAGLAIRAMNDRLLWYVVNELPSLKITPKGLPTYSRLSFQKKFSFPPLREMIFLQWQKFEVGTPVRIDTINQTASSQSSNSQPLRFVTPLSLLISVNNTSVFSIPDLGDIRLELFSAENSYLGYLSAQNVSFLRDENWYQMRGLLDPTNPSVVSELMRYYIRGEPVAIIIRPKMASVPLLDTVIDGFTIKIDGPASQPRVIPHLARS